MAGEFSMLQLTQLALDCYFAAVLGVSGLAKIDNPALFAVTLRRQRLLPRWSITSVSYIPLGRTHTRWRSHYRGASRTYCRPCASPL